MNSRTLALALPAAIALGAISVSIAGCTKESDGASEVQVAGAQMPRERTRHPVGAPSPSGKPRAPTRAAKPGRDD